MGLFDVSVPCAAAFTVNRTVSRPENSEIERPLSAAVGIECKYLGLNAAYTHAGDLSRTRGAVELDLYLNQAIFNAHNSSAIASIQCLTTRSPRWRSDVVTSPTRESPGCCYTTLQ